MNSWKSRPIDKYKAVLFDLDGTLIKSMELHYHCWSQVLDEFGIRINRHNFLLSEGTNINRLMYEYTGLEDQHVIKNLIRSKDELFIKKFKFELYEGALEFLSLLNKMGKKLGLVTASSKLRLESTAPNWFIGFFDVIICSEDGGRGKPFPDPYLSASQKLRVDPDEILVIENAPLGIQASRAAKMDCIGISNTLPKELLGEANLHYSSFIEILEKVI
jgi:HAD superfamily hydrolase (TIGR01509 family)